MANRQGDFARKMAMQRGEGLSQNEAADLAGISRTLWRNMEDPEYPYRVRRGNIVKAARVLAWDLEEALRLAGYTEPPTDLELAAMRRGPRDDLNRLLRQLTESQVRALVGLIETMLNPQAPPRSEERWDRVTVYGGTEDLGEEPTVQEPSPEIGGVTPSRTPDSSAQNGPAPS